MRGLLIPSPASHRDFTYIHAFAHWRTRHKHTTCSRAGTGPVSGGKRNDWLSPEVQNLKITPSARYSEQTLNVKLAGFIPTCLSHRGVAVVSEVTE